MVGPDAMGLPDRVLRETFDKIDAVRMDIAESSAVRRSIGAIGADVLARAERIADGQEEEPGFTTVFRTSIASYSAIARVNW